MIQIKPSFSAVSLESSTRDWTVWKAAHQLTYSGTKHKQTQTEV